MPHGTHSEVLSALSCLPFKSYKCKLSGVSDLRDKRNAHMQNGDYKNNNSNTANSEKMSGDMGASRKYINLVSLQRHAEFNHVDLDKEKYVVIL